MTKEAILVIRAAELHLERELTRDEIKTGLGTILTDADYAALGPVRTVLTCHSTVFIACTRIFQRL